MKKDRLENLLKDVLASEPAERDLGKVGLSRFRSRVMAGTDASTRLDEALHSSIGESPVPIRDHISDEGLRRLRNRLADQRKPVWVPLLRPALVFAAVAVVVLVFSLTRTAISPVGEPISGAPGLFDKALTTRGDIIAMLPDSERVENTSYSLVNSAGEMSTNLNSVLGHLDSFSTKARGESFARKIDSNRRTIMAALTTGKEGSKSTHGGRVIQGEVSPAPTRHQVLLVDKLDRVTAGF